MLSQVKLSFVIICYIFVVHDSTATQQRDDQGKLPGPYLLIIV